MTTPSWFTAMQWSPAVGVEALRSNRQLLPLGPGVYVFTNYGGALEKNTGVLYVGKAASLASRVQSYLVNPAELRVMSERSGSPRISSSLRHAGKVQLLVEIQQKSRGIGSSGLWIRWTQVALPHMLESQLIQYLRPAFNTQGVAK